MEFDEDDTNTWRKREGSGEVVERHGAAAAAVFVERDTWREGFERGHVMRGGRGDPLSPGWSGVEGGESLGLEDSEVLKRFPKIPSLPLSAEAAERILESLGGAPLPLDWRGTLKSSKVKNVGGGAGGGDGSSNGGVGDSGVGVDNH